ncbi:trypsin-like peptidase domain-containing protein [Solwaraspora sp. WMMD406]|uniref:S1C family serine protease n=1 Tax=Solwaraspora sp. WMMD406 TaxID=3016095 RepID=UPI002417EC79|nr:trypsin-like peptidase domain-containing protein [Solwaraspora sp. WMMD406]MDG4767603.1 trypsin-like peptidase domain-containing protein [Solwaraspora sp. WMMD406]
MSEHESTPQAEPAGTAQPSASPWQSPPSSSAPGPSQSQSPAREPQGQRPMGVPQDRPAATAARGTTDWTPTNQPYAGPPAPPGADAAGPGRAGGSRPEAAGPAESRPQPAAPPSPGAPSAGIPASGAPTAGPTNGPTTGVPASAHQAAGAPSSGPYAPARPAAGQYTPGQAQVPYGGQWSTSQGYPGQPYAGHGYPGQSYPGRGYGQPGVTWAPPPGAAAEAAGQRRGGRVARTVIGGAVVLALMLGSGAVGGAVVAVFDDGATPAVQTSGGSGSAAPVVDRSSLAGIAEAVQDSVVSISTGSSEGSGVVLNTDGFILTNNHVIESAQGGAVSVVFADGSTAQGSVIGTDARTDLAVVKVEGVDGLSPATFGDSSAMLVGDTVLALGSPLGLQGSVTAGIISAQNRTIQVGGSQQQNPFGGGGGQVTSMSGLLQTDAPINPGNSGGALVNTNGEVIGINTAIATSGQGEGNIGVGFAIPSNRAKEVAETLMAGEEVVHPYLGVNVTGGEDGGAVIGAVEPDSPADQAGLTRGDVVTRVGDTAITDADDLVAAVQAGTVGEEVEITYLRDDQERTTTATLAEAP